MTLTIHHDLIQNSDEWIAARAGLLCASEMKQIVTPSLKPAQNDRSRAHFYELLAQRISGHVEPHYISDDMLRGQEDEIEARALYTEHHAPVETVGFITRDFGGFRIGYSPDGLVGADGLIEIKSRRQKYQVQTILDGEMPDEFEIQVQTGLLVSGRAWCDFVSYSGGLPLFVARVLPDARVQEAILAAAAEFEERMADALLIYRDRVEAGRFVQTVRREREEMML